MIVLYRSIGCRVRSLVGVEREISLGYDGVGKEGLMKSINKIWVVG